MPWNWQLPEWPHFIYESSSLLSLEKKFLQGIGGAFAVLKYLEEEKQKELVVDILSTEAINSAEIEGEILKRKSLQSSIRRHLGLFVDDEKIPLKEQGMGNLLWSVYNTYNQPLTHEILYEWHRLLMKGESRISNIGKYRTHEEPMQIVAGRYDDPTVYFEAPLSHAVHKEMDRFIQWFNASKEESILAKAATVHVYFGSIHPFEDGNGRIGRALVEKSLSQSLLRPTLIAVSQEITRRKKEYYEALGICNNTLHIEKWMQFFAEIIVHAQEESFRLINFLMAKSQLMTHLTGKMNPRQEKVLLRMFEEGSKGFMGGLSAEKYISITKTSSATATRDLIDLVEKKALVKTGELKYTRYWLNVNI